jgi:hypothetical protein
MIPADSSRWARLILQRRTIGRRGRGRVERVGPFLEVERERGVEQVGHDEAIDEKGTDLSMLFSAPLTEVGPTTRVMTRGDTHLIPRAMLPKSTEPLLDPFLLLATPTRSPLGLLLASSFSLSFPIPGPLAPRLDTSPRRPVLGPIIVSPRARPEGVVPMSYGAAI